jgi:antibiotic biosynthesis monooxygenase (ABM) superfamily enzyme
MGSQTLPAASFPKIVDGQSDNNLINQERTSYQTQQSRLISLENKLDNVKNRKQASSVKKYLLLSLFLLYLLLMFMFYIIDINVPLDVKAKFSMLINGLILVALLIYEIVRLFQRL